MSGLLPAAVRARLAELAAGRSRATLAASSGRLSDIYRAGRNSSAAVLSEQDALAYALVRMPATYAAVSRALEAADAVCPQHAPKSLLDIGCGPGSASLAAINIWPTIDRLTLIDRNAPFLMLAADLLALDGVGRDMAVLNQPLPGGLAAQPHDIVLASYVLVELEDGDARTLIDRLWSLSAGTLILVEPGTPAGFGRLAAARHRLLADGAHILAPCTHEAACPIRQPDWCHFKARVQRSRDHRQIKGADAPFEDEPFAYLVVARTPAEARASHRIIRPVEDGKAGVRLTCCASSGLATIEATKRDGEKYKSFKRLDWGDAVLIQNPAVDAENQSAGRN